MEPPKDEDWIGLEDELAPTEIRRRIRGKVSLSHLALNLSDPSQEEGVEEEEEEEVEEEEKREELKKMRRVV